ncbi:hypothetical protein DVR12_22585 [Chitinophaga silvatica]|uniref:Uncharacterized protein n=1 Tax=Chitinophaga silvatica TaxID=2282649 RepID=A0A3E1Y420_9BACT|nr:hypothetical protein DVR12_22585 [Chitinophaga silvatica]
MTIILMTRIMAAIQVNNPRMIRIPPTEEYGKLKFEIQTPQTDKGQALINMLDINFRYNNKLLWNNLSFQIRSRDRVQIAGDGKTFLLKIITHELKPCAGSYNSTGFSFFYLECLFKRSC